MEVRKGYKKTEVGIIPEEWKCLNVEDCLSIKTGGKNTEDKQNNGQYPFFVRSQQVERIDSFSFDCEAVLTAGDGVGTGKVFHYINGKFDVHQRVYIMSGFKNITGKYFYNYFSNFFYDEVCKYTAKSSVDSVRRDMIAKMLLPIPPLPEQQAIAIALSDIDGLISSLTKLIDKKKNIKEGAMQELLTGKKRIDGFSGEWVLGIVANLGKAYGGLTGKTKEDFGHGNSRYIPFMNVMSNPIIDLTYLEYVNIKNGEFQNSVRYGDLFFNTSSETPEEVGMCSVLFADVESLYINSFCFGFRLNNLDETNPLFLSYLFRSNIGRQLMFSLAQGATRYNLSKNNFYKLEFRLPDYKEQTAIATFLYDMDEEIRTLQNKLTKYKAIKQGMMQELLTGRIRLVEEVMQ